MADVGEFLARLDEFERIALVQAIKEGHAGAWRAVRCIGEAGSDNDAARLLEYLDEAIRLLQGARALVSRRA